MPTVVLKKLSFSRLPRFNTAGLNAYWKFAMRKIVNEKEDIFVNVPFVNFVENLSGLNYRGT